MFGGGDFAATRRAVMAMALAIGGLGALGWPAPAAALDVDGAKSFAQTTADRLLSLIREERPVEEKRADFKALLQDVAALPQIARFAVGSPWDSMSDAQKAAYEIAFAEYLSKIYVRRFDDYKGEGMTIVDAEDRGKKGVLVNTQVEAPGAEPLSVIWRVTDRFGGVKLLDLNVEGVSMLVTQRDEFAGMLDRVGGDIDQFIATLTEAGS